jgi:hypothetical protein
MQRRILVLPARLREKGLREMLQKGVTPRLER